MARGAVLKKQATICEKLVKADPRNAEMVPRFIGERVESGRMQVIKGDLTERPDKFPRGARHDVRVERAGSEQCWLATRSAGAHK